MPRKMTVKVITDNLIDGPVVFTSHQMEEYDPQKDKIPFTFRYIEHARSYMEHAHAERIPEETAGMQYTDDFQGVYRMDMLNYNDWYKLSGQMDVYDVRWPGAKWGTDFSAESEQEALDKHATFFANTVRREERSKGRTAVKHVRDNTFSCDACHFAPCKHATGN